VKGPRPTPKQPKLLGAERSPDRPGKSSHPGESPETPHRPHGLPWTEARKDTFAIAGSTDEVPGPERRPRYPIGPPSMWQRNDQRTPGTPARRQPSEGYAEAPEREAQPLLLWTSGLREARVTEPHAPATACRHRSPPGSLRLPTGSPLQISNESSRSRAAGVMATSDRQGPTPLAFSNLPRMLASGTERNRGRNETTAPHASRCFGNKKR
jgi:hypothetical protein